MVGPTASVVVLIAAIDVAETMPPVYCRYAGSAVANASTELRIGVGCSGPFSSHPSSGGSSTKSPVPPVQAGAVVVMVSAVMVHPWITELEYVEHDVVAWSEEQLTQKSVTVAEVQDWVVVDS